MVQTKNILKHSEFVSVSHDLKRRILEITSFIRVLNNYYYLRNYVYNEIKKVPNSPVLSIKKVKDLRPSITSKIKNLTQRVTNLNDSFKFPDSIILFEAWMNLGMGALYPRMALHFKFPGFLKGEKVRNLYQFTFATSRGFGFPIYFGPNFYGYTLTYGKFLEIIFRWSHTICHRANQAIQLVGNRYKIRRHHPGEFESVIISEYENNNFKAIDTLLHGYFTNAPKRLGKFPDLKSVIQQYLFSYSIGDHAMSIELRDDTSLLKVPLLSNKDIIEQYSVNFFSYIKKLKAFRLQLIKKLIKHKKRKRELSPKLKFSERSKFKANPLYKQFSLELKLMEKLSLLLWTTPLSSHTQQTNMNDKSLNKPALMKSSSIFLAYIKVQEIEWDFTFKDEEILNRLYDLQEHITLMWTSFKEEYFNSALKKLDEISSISITQKDYASLINRELTHLIPIFSIYEIFNRSLSESVYPESIPQTKRLGAYFARFLSSKYNLFGVNLMRFFNKLAFYNWCYLIKKQQKSLPQLFNLILKLPIWKYIPLEVKERIIRSNIELAR